MVMKVLLDNMVACGSRFDRSGRLFDIFSLICVGVHMGYIPAVSPYIHSLQEYRTFVYSDGYECIGYIQYQAKSFPQSIIFIATFFARIKF